MSSETSEDPEFTETMTEQDGSRPPGVRVFPLLAIPLLVFPIALGIGFTLQTPTPPPGKLAAAEEPAPTIPNNIQPKPPERHLPGPDRSKGDDLLREGRYEAALHHYRSLGSADSLRVPPELALRMAFCQEGLGLWDEALAIYRSVASTDQPLLATSAVLGQSRIWMRLNNFATAEPLLRSILLKSGDPRILPPDALGEVAMLYSIALAEHALMRAEQSASAGLVPVANPMEWSLNDALKWSNEKSTASPISETNEVALRVLLPSQPNAAGDGLVTSDNGKDPLDNSLLVTARQQPLAEILSRATVECGLRLEWSDALQQRAAARVVDATIRDLPLSLVMSAACREIGGDWTILPLAKTIIVTETTTDPHSDRHQRDMGAAVLAGTMALFPDHRLTSAAKFARAQLAAADGRFGDAGQLYSSLIGRSSSPLAIRAAFNGALAYYRLGDLVRTCKSLEVVVHGAPGNELHTRSVILYGRTLMDRGEFREAAFQLKRAAESRHLPEDQARAAVFLAMAQILDGRPHDAAESLFVHRLQFQDRAVRNAAALMTSIARWRTSTGPSRNREAAFLYRSIVAVEADSDWLGSTGQLLLGQAMHDAELDEKMSELYSRSLEQGVCTIVEFRMKQALAEYWYTHDRVTEAKAIWSKLHAAGGPDSVAAAMRLAEVALDEQQPDLCLELCHALQQHDKVSRSDLLKVAGRAYELSGQPVLAAQCYAGQWPLP